MKKIILIIIFLPCFSFAKYSVEVNMLTEHFFIPCDKAWVFENKTGDCGSLIKNTIIGVGEDLGDDLKVKYFAGKNSVDELMAGISFTYIKQSQGFNYGPILGSYMQDNTTFKKRGIKTFGIDFFNYKIMPIVGGELQYKIGNFKVFSVITPALMTLGFGVDF